MSWVIRTSIHIAAPVATVWSVMTDVEKWPEWTASVLSVRRLDNGNFRLGSRARIRQPKFLPAVWQVTKLIEGRSFTWEMRTPGLRAEGYHAVQRSGSGSRAELRVAYDGPLGGFVAKLLANTTHRFLELEAAGLKKRSESATARLA